MNPIRTRIIALVAGAFAITAALVPGLAFAEVSPADVPSGLQSAIKSAVESRGQEYAGFCREIDQSAHIGEYCAFVQSINGDVAEVTVGRVLSDEITAMTFKKTGDTWARVTSAPGAPNTGSGLGSGDSDGMLFVAIGLGAVAAGLGAGSLAFARRPSR